MVDQPEASRMKGQSMTRGATVSLVDDAIYTEIDSYVWEKDDEDAIKENTM